MRFVLSHPSDKNKYVARVGHPLIRGYPITGHLTLNAKNAFRMGHPLPRWLGSPGTGFASRFCGCGRSVTSNKSTPGRGADSGRTVPAHRARAFLPPYNGARTMKMDA